MFEFLNYFFKRGQQKDDEEKIKNLTDELADAKDENFKLWKKVQILENKERDYQQVLMGYDQLIEKSINETDQIKEEKKKLEKNYGELLDSYNVLNFNLNKAKTVIAVQQKNEALLKKQVSDMEKILNKRPQSIEFEHVEYDGNVGDQFFEKVTDKKPPAEPFENCGHCGVLLQEEYCDFENLPIEA